MLEQFCDYPSYLFFSGKGVGALSLSRAAAWACKALVRAFNKIVWGLFTTTLLCGFKRVSRVESLQVHLIET